MPPTDPTKDHNLTEEEREHEQVRAQAQEIMLQLHAQKRESEKRPETNNLARPLVQELRRALDYQNEDMVATLEQQAAALDSAFRRLLSNADTTYENNENCDAAYAQYAAAFRAQDLFCRTARALNHLKKQDKKPKDKDENT